MKKPFCGAPRNNPVPNSSCHAENKGRVIIVKNKKRLTAVPALLLCCALLCGCGSKPQAETVHVPAETPAPTPAPTAAPYVMPEAEQRSLIERSRSVWLPEDLAYETWFYTVTDLDRNGRLELITASLQGSGLYTWANVWEVNEGFTGLNECPDDIGEGQGWPDLIKDSLPYYYDAAAGRYSYVCEDITRDGGARYYTALESFALQNGRLSVRALASMEELYDAAGASTKHYFNAAGSPISAQEYETAASSAFAGQEQGTLSLSWTQLEAPQATPQPQYPAQTQQPYQLPVTPVPQQAAGPVTVTKNPTGETVTPGGKTWFIAHADNATQLTWIFTGPQGQVCNLRETMAANPGLYLEELEQDTLAVSNIPQSLDGWSVQARFDGPGGSAVTAPALITVENTIMAYAEPLSKYYYALSNGINDPAYAYDNGISEYYSSVSHMGYALLDLDGNGTQELLIAGAGIGPDDYAYGVLFDLYTLQNGAPVQIACSSARNRYYLRADYGVLNEGSGGAGHSIFVLNRVQGAQLVPVESVFTFYDNAPGDGMYHQSNGFSYEPRSYDEQLTEESFAFYVNNWEAGISVPQLTQFA